MAPPRKSSGKGGVKPGASNQRDWSRAEEEHAVDTMRQRLAPRITDRDLLRRYVRMADLDVNLAVNWWQRDRARLATGNVPVAVPPAQVNDDEVSSEGGDDLDEDVGDDTSVDAAADGGNGLLDMMRANPIAARFNENVEQERRDAALAFRLSIEETSLGTVVLSPAQAIFFLHLCSWDLGTAVARWNAVSLRENCVLLGQFDHMREPLHHQVITNDVATTRGQDERLALFINITGRDDWVSLRDRLVEADYNLIEAVVAWFRPGVRPSRPSRTSADSGIRVGVDMVDKDWPVDADCDAAEATVMDESWGTELDAFNPASSPDPSTPAATKTNDKMKASDQTEQGRSTLKMPARARTDGYLIHIDPAMARATAQLRVVNTGLFLVEWIARGRYWFNRFKHKGFRWPELGGKQQQSLPLFDWNNQDNINLLNNWRRQTINRATGFQLRQGSQQWSQEEIDFLVALTEELFQEAKVEFPNTTDDELLPLTVTTKKKQEWERRFNAKFEGTIQPGSTKPREARKHAALMTHRGRIRVLVDRYKVNPDKAWFDKEAKRKAKAGDKRKRSPSEEKDQAEQTQRGSGDDADVTLATTVTGDDEIDSLQGQNEKKSDDKEKDGDDDQARKE